MSPRKKDEKKYTKYVGIFLAVIMVGSIGMFFFSGSSTNSGKVVEQGDMVSLDFTLMQEDGAVIETSNEDVAEKNNIEATP
ncbi:MAG: hypothetical protein ACOCPU_05660, partial [Methanohalophilus sp.]